MPGETYYLAVHRWIKKTCEGIKFADDFEQWITARIDLIGRFGGWITRRIDG